MHALCIDGPAFDQVTTMSKFLCLGVDLPTVIKAATLNAAQALQREDLATFKPGAVGDASILSHDMGAFDYVDSTGERLRGEQRLAAKAVVIDGKVWHEA